MESNSPSQKLYETAKLETIGKGNPVFVKRMLGVFVMQMNESIQQLNAFLHNPEQVYTIMHQARPGIVDICNSELVQICDNIERLSKQHYTAEMIEQIQLFSQRMQEVITQIELQELSSP